MDRTTDIYCLANGELERSGTFMGIFGTENEPPEGYWAVSRRSIAECSLPQQYKDWLLLDANSSPTMDVRKRGLIWRNTTLTISSDIERFGILRRQINLFCYPEFEIAEILPNLPYWFKPVTRDLTQEEKRLKRELDTHIHDIGVHAAIDLFRQAAFEIYHASQITNS